MLSENEFETDDKGGGVPALECIGDPCSLIDEAGVVRRELLRDMCSKIVTGPVTALVVGSPEVDDEAEDNLAGISTTGAKFDALLELELLGPLMLPFTAPIEELNITLSTGLVVG